MMAMKALEGFEARVLRQVKSTDTRITLSAGDAAKLNAVGTGNYAYLTIKDPVSREVVKYHHTDDWGSGRSRVEVPIDRDAGGSGAKNFCAFACVKHEASVPFLTDFITGLIQANGGV